MLTHKTQIAYASMLISNLLSDIRCIAIWPQQPECVCVSMQHMVKVVQSIGFHHLHKQYGKRANRRIRMGWGISHWLVLILCLSATGLTWLTMVTHQNRTQSLLGKLVWMIELIHGLECCVFTRSAGVGSSSPLCCLHARQQQAVNHKCLYCFSPIFRTMVCLQTGNGEAVMERVWLARLLAR